MTGNSEGTSTDILVNGKFIYFLRLVYVSPKWENGNEFYYWNQLLFCFGVINDVKSFGLISQEVACAIKVCLYFAVSSVAVIFVSIYLKMMRQDPCCSKNIIFFFFFKGFFNNYTWQLTSESWQSLRTMWMNLTLFPTVKHKKKKPAAQL